MYIFKSDLGKPHLGTDKLIVILRNIRAYLISAGVEFRFGCAVDDFHVQEVYSSISVHTFTTIYA